MYGLEEEISESSFAEKDLVPVNRKLDVNWRYVLATQKADSILGCINRGVTAGRRGSSPSVLLL